MSSELKVPADPLLHKRSTEAARETHAETGEPKDVYVDGITWRLECPNCRSGGIGLEVFVTVNKECSDGRRKYTRLETNVQR